MTKLTCYRLGEEAPRLVAARSERAWMDATMQRFAYRCLPLTIANSMGWELLAPVGLTAIWNGGPELSDLTVVSDEGSSAEGFAQSHFGHGILTFQTRYLFRTEPGTTLWIRGAPNLPKDGIAALDGIVETDWLSFTFTMNWMFTRPGEVRFEREEPFCFITPVGYQALEGVVPEIFPVEANPELKSAYEAYRTARLDFNKKLAAGDPETVKTGWQKWYMRGQTPSGETGNSRHVSKLRLAEPRNAATASDAAPENGA
jgi:hypothetical protein